MKTAIIVICLLFVLYWIFAKINNFSYKRANTKGGSAKGQKVWNSPVLLILPLIVIVAISFITIIPAQTCGVVITPNGVQQKSYSTGWHPILPIYKVQLMDKTAQVYTCARSTSYNDGDYREYKADATQSGTVWSPTIDGIKMGFDISASWCIDPEYAWWIYDNVSEQDGSRKGRFYWLEENVIKPKLKSALALTVSKYNPIEVYSNRRQDIQDEVYEKMKNDIQSYHLILNQIDIREVYYNSDYEEAINAKKLEEQRVLSLVEITKQKRELETQAAIDKNIAILQAEGEAEALRIKGQSISRSPQVVTLEWINKWDGKLPVYMLGDGQGIMLNLNNTQK